MKILFATDFSDTAKHASQTLVALQQQAPQDIYLVHVITSFWKNWFSSGVYEKEAMQRLQNWQQQLGSKNDDHLLIKIGNVADEIIATGLDINADIIIIGAKTNHKTRYTTGAKIESIVRGSNSSVWISRGEKLNSILCGIDGSESSAIALQKAIAISQQFNASLSILYTLPSLDINPLGLNQTDLEDKENQFKQKQTDKIENFLKGFDFGDLKVEKLFKWGNPANVLLDQAEDFNHDLVVVGAKGHSKLHHVLVGSTAAKILRHCPCSLLVAR